MDSWVSLCLVIYFIELLLTRGTTPWNEFLVQHPLSVHLLNFFFLTWCLLRIFEAARLGKNLPEVEVERMQESTLFMSLEKSVAKLLRSERNLTSISALIVILIAAGLLFEMNRFPHLSLLAVALLPCSVPFYQWFGSKILRQTAQDKIALPDISLLGPLSKIRHFRCHQHGVFTQADLTLFESWFDPSCGWVESELSAIVGSLTQHSEHPVCISLSQNYCPRKTYPIKLADIENIPYLGLRVNLKDEAGKNLEIQLGNLNWLRLESHDVSKEAERLIESWKAESLSHCFLSLNKRLVAAFAFEQKEKSGLGELFDFIRTERKQIVLMSSSHHSTLAVNALSFDEVSMNLLPLERDLQKQYWADRATQFIELRSNWDKEPNPEEKNIFSIVFSENPQEREITDKVYILSRDLNGLRRLIREAMG